MLKDKFAKRFEELHQQYCAFIFVPDESWNCPILKDDSWRRWGTSGQNLILAVFGENSPHYSRYCAAFDRCNQTEPCIRAVGSVFESAKEDFDGDYIFNVESQVSAEIFGDFIVMAKESLANGYKDVAAVLASAALEDALKKYAAIKGLQTEDSTMTKVIHALKSAGLVSGAQKSILESMPKVRNAAMHADWGKISEPEINSVIGFVESFLLTKFQNG